MRSEVVAESRSWIGTPYHRRAFIKGVGVDCGLLPYAVYRKFELIPEFTAEWLANDWFANTTQERYLLMIERYLKKLFVTQARRDFRPEFLPGNLVVAKVFDSPVFNHAGIITTWPRVVHAVPDCVSEVDAAADPAWAGRVIAVFDIGLPA